MKQKFKGGKGDKLNPRDVDPQQLKMGIKIEKEHTNSAREALEIALDHLAEDPQYYTKLKQANLESKVSLLSLVKEMKAKPGLRPVKDLYKQEVFNYYARRLNNPYLNADDRYIGKTGYFRNKVELQQLIDKYFNEFYGESDDWDDWGGPDPRWNTINLDSFDSKTFKKVIKQIKDYYSNELYESKTQLNEYSQKVIDQLMANFRVQDHHLDDIQVLSYINRFDQLKNNIRQKFENPETRAQIELLIPRELQAKNKYLDITQWKNFNDLKKIVDASSKKDEDVYKKAIDIFKKKNSNVDENAIKYYVNVFKSRLKDLKDFVNNNDENVLSNIPQNLLNGEKYLNINNWEFRDLEHLIDAVFPRQQGKQNKKVEINSAETDADQIYNENGIEVYKGDSEHKCIRYGKNEYYSWCISRARSNNMYYSYRLGNRNAGELMFYFVFDKSKTDERGPSGFKDPYHVVVIHALSNGKYMRSTANNDGDKPGGGASWEELGQSFIGKQGQELWDKIKGLKKLFQYQDPSEEELKIKDYKDKKLSLAQFQALPFTDKKYWLRANASVADNVTGKNPIITSEIVKTLPAQGDVSKNDLINYDRRFSFNEFEGNKGLLKRYAIYRFTRHPDEPLPYKFIPYLVEPGKEDSDHLQREYFKKFAEEYLTLEEIEKYFSPQITQNYVDSQIKRMGWLPEMAKSYMSDAQKKFYDVYSLSFTNFKLEGETIEDEDTKAPEHSYYLFPWSYSEFQKMGQNKKSYISLIKRLSDKPLSEELGDNAFWMGIPISFLIDGKLYFFVSKDPTDGSNVKQEYYLIDEDGKILSENNKFNIQVFNNTQKLKLNDLNSFTSADGSPVLKESDFNKIQLTKLDGKNEILTTQQLVTLKEQTEWFNNSLLFKAGLIS